MGRFQPGAGQSGPSRRRQTGQRVAAGKISDERKAWTDIFLGQFVLMVYPEGHEVGSKESGETVKIVVPQRKVWDLTHLTEEELDSLQKFFDRAFARARPIIRHRDEVASDAFSRGDDSFSRVYRAVPQFFDREGAVTADGQSVQHGPENVLAGDGDGSDSDGVRGPGDELAHDEPQNGESEND